MTVATLQGSQAELPSPESTKSYWHREPSRKLLGHRTTPDLPAKADMVVVGSGITGSFAARELVRGGRDVVLLEAREACFGATGRNGGHCQPFLYGNKPHIARFELDTFNYLKALVDEHGIACDWKTVGGVHRLDTDELVDLVAQHLETLRRKHPDLADKVSLITNKAELDALRISNAAGAVVQPYAAKLWPYKLVSWVLEQLLEENDANKFNIQTNTPVTHLQHVEISSSDQVSWIVHTPRGQVAARDVLLATNAYTSHLLPGMASLLVPVRGQVCALKAPSGSKPLGHTHVWVSDGGDDYLIQRDHDPEYPALILGGERLCAKGGEVGISRDDGVNEEIGKRLRRAVHDALKFAGADEPEQDELTATHEWTGIMGYTADEHPWVGPVTARLFTDGKQGESSDGPLKGLWLCGGYTGHGMPVAARCAVAAAEMILGEEPTVKLPQEFRVSNARATALQNKEVGTLDMLDILREVIRGGTLDEAAG